jgi:hypothetical protein
MIPEQELEELKYPIGKFSVEGEITDEQVAQWINGIASLPVKLRDAINGLTDEQLNTPYRPGGWTVKQVVHHIGDSHLNSIIRFKWTITEDKPVIKAYNEKKWAETKDYELYDINDSLDFITMLHKKFVVLLKSLTSEDLNRIFVHPETNKEVILRRNVGIYEWHGRHHTAHITKLRERNSW